MVTPDSHIGFYARVSNAFDQAAGTYDAAYKTNPVMAWMRQRSLAVLQATFAPGSRLLEIGCGTGDEALTLSRAGYQIVATDISTAMIEAAQIKAEETTEDVAWLVLPAGQLGGLLSDYGPGFFDGAYASFGALNCEPDLATVADALDHLLAPNGAFVCSVMNRWCAWEIAWGLLHLQPRQALRRLGSGWIQAGLATPAGRTRVPARYYSPRGFARPFAPQFRVRRVLGLPVLLPPPHLAHLLDREPAFFSRVERIEGRIHHRIPFRTLGDHFLIVLGRAGMQETV
jgi:ubiquinone/menaquinone biosynthesis C-methylase UbiE